MSKFEIHDNYRDNGALRDEFFLFTGKIYPRFDFSGWFMRGYWLDNYIPISIVVDNKIVSNISITKMKILLEGRLQNGIQIGTVGTIPEYRKQGLSRVLMAYILDKYKDATDLFFLFANETVLDFYPKFGFRGCREVIFKSVSDIPGPRYGARKLSPERESDMAVMADLLTSRKDLTEIFGARDYDFITLWHILNIFPNDLYYLEKDNIILIVTEEREQLHIWDIIYKEAFDINSAISGVMQNDRIKSVIYHFPPDKLPYHYDTVEIDGDSGLFVKGDFPIENRQFKFPVTAQT
jgi:GNAT superfamily N-acetyltransferase